MNRHCRIRRHRPYRHPLPLHAGHPPTVAPGPARALRRAALGAALLLALAATPALAADPPCVDGNPDTDQGSEHGTDNSTCGPLASAYGHGNLAWGDNSSAVGYGNQASGENSSAFGEGNLANDQSSSAFGFRNEASGFHSAAFGSTNVASYSYATAFGYRNTASAYRSAAFGYGNTVSRWYSSAFGVQNTASGEYSSAFGYGNTASGDNSSVFGHGSAAEGLESSAFGFQAQALNPGSTAIGHQATADRDYSVSVGSAGNERQIIHVADGTAATDAVNLRQVQAADAGTLGAAQAFATGSVNALGAGVAGWLGGGAGHAGGVFTAPTYLIQGASYDNVGDAFAAVDLRLTDLQGRIDTIELTPGPEGPAGPAGPQGPEGPAGGAGDDPQVVKYDDGSHGQLTLGGEQGTRLSNLADGTAASDAATVGQVEAGSAQVAHEARQYTDTAAARTLASANDYTDARFAAWDDEFTAFRGDVARRFSQQDRRIDRIGAMGSAMIGMASSAAAVQGNHRTRIGAGVGHANGENALAVGLQHGLGSRAAITLGGAFSGSERSAMIGIGVGL